MVSGHRHGFSGASDTVSQFALGVGSELGCSLLHTFSRGMCPACEISPRWGAWPESLWKVVRASAVEDFTSDPQSVLGCDPATLVSLCQTIS